jgi:hypothetical protein
MGPVEGVNLDRVTGKVGEEGVVRPPQEAHIKPPTRSAHATNGYRERASNAPSRRLRW